jgi:hypothetical protein
MSFPARRQEQPARPACRWESWQLVFKPPGREARPGPEAGTGAVVVRLRATQEQHSPGAGEDQHGNNTDETAFPGT